ncbi:MAG: hypothetical protein LCH81_03775 [Bacteroidetes bacterium]|nr:hypothetical protein [Bacteroidota bacterium]
MRNNELDLETAIDYLAGRDITIQKIVDKMGIDRNKFNSWRRSTKPGRKAALHDELKKMFPELENVSPPTEDGHRASLGEKYTQLLEKNIEELKRERDDLKKQNEELLQEILRNIRRSDPTAT